MDDLQKVGENMGIRNCKVVISEVSEAVSNWMKFAKDCGVKAEHANTIGKNLLLFGRELYVVDIPNTISQDEQIFLNAVRNDDFNVLMKLKLNNYQPSEILLRNIRDEVSTTTFIAVAKIFGKEKVLHDIQGIQSRPNQLIDCNQKDMKM